MGNLTPSQRAAIVKQMKVIKAKIQNPRLTIEEVDLLRKERALLEKQIMNDRNSFLLDAHESRPTIECGAALPARPCRQNRFW